MPNLVQKLANHTWYHQRFDGSPLYLFLVGAAEVRAEKRKPQGTEAVWRICFFEQGKADWYLDQADIDRGVAIMTKTQDQSGSRIMEQWQADEEAFQAFFETFSPDHLAPLNDDALLEIYETYERLALNRFSSSSIIDHFALGSDDMVAAMIRKEAGPIASESAFNRIFSLATAPVHQSFINEAEIALLNIALLVQHDQDIASEEIQHLLEEHQRKYFWINNNYISSHILPISYFEDEIRTWLETGKDLQVERDRLEQTPLRNAQAKQELFQNYHFSPALRRLLKISEDFTRWQDERKKATFLSIYLGTTILTEMASRRHLNPELTKYFLPNGEVKGWFTQGMPNTAVLKQRQNGCFVVWEQTRQMVYTGADVSDLRQAIARSVEHDLAQDIRGLVASTGKATGVAKIVTSVGDISKINQGDILIAVMTRPDYVPAMKRAAAIVTDEGGITCHAAIVSRELGVPCIIGTRIATKAFHDGDTIEVNANHNWIRKLH